MLVVDFYVGLKVGLIKVKSVDNLCTLALPSEYTACRNSFPTRSSFFFIFSTGGKVKSEM